ncbi:cupin domain-containing protein [Catellatospora sp. KI3]|uniref:cupin domain-containing protein n=1 Tax=Catellatospora sp. KI3 TaxID=3041620 RepID=UPI002482CE12|nr:cupin domain-containing protein [Catellatospora sp. KI3]MDI1460789.1 cupin domain-containing protein [Catellatospora sp. KI3]
MDDTQLSDAYGIRYQQLYPHGGEELAPWGVGRAVVEPGGSTEPHEHTENEVFVFLSGTGTMTIGDESCPVDASTSVLIPAGSRHHVANTSATERLVFLSVYWPAEHGPIDL